MFTASWYMILITKRSPVALLGGHYVDGVPLRRNGGTHHPVQSQTERRAASHGSLQSGLHVEKRLFQVGDVISCLFSSLRWIPYHIYGLMSTLQSHATTDSLPGTWPFTSRLLETIICVLGNKSSLKISVGHILGRCCNHLLRQQVLRRWAAYTSPILSCQNLL